ncbi:MAG: type IV secretion system protein [Candidatus Accumulibacter sp.]|jgi:type IV secretion system protein VirB8|nr:type IV secretion system protein [Accumulibacter sp.]
MKSTSNPKRRPQSFIEAAEDFERFKIEEIKKSRKIAWLVASVSMGITVVSILAFLVALLTRPEPEPTIIQVDNATGATMLLRSIRDSQDRYDEVVNKYWLANYVRIREGYDWYTIGEQFEAVKLMSEADIASEYAKTVQAPNAPLVALRDRAKIVAKINTISFIGDMAQVRFTTEKQSTSGENTDGSPVQKWIATIAFHFKPGYMTLSRDDAIQE